MTRRQTRVPRQWLIADERLGQEMFELIRRLPRGSGVLVRHHHLPPGQRERLLRRIRRLVLAHRLVVVDEARGVTARVHGPGQVRQAGLARVGLLLLSPLHATRSHPEWKPMPRMRAAALVRLARMPVVALGGMDERRFRAVQGLGFVGWAGIDAWLKFTRASGERHPALAALA